MYLLLWHNGSMQDTEYLKDITSRILALKCLGTIRPRLDYIFYWAVYSLKCFQENVQNRKIVKDLKPPFSVFWYFLWYFIIFWVIKSVNCKMVLVETMAHDYGWSWELCFILQACYAKRGVFGNRNRESNARSAQGTDVRNLSRWKV